MRDVSRAEKWAPLSDEAVSVFLTVLRRHLHRENGVGTLGDHLRPAVSDQVTLAEIGDLVASISGVIDGS